MYVFMDEELRGYLTFGLFLAQENIDTTTGSKDDAYSICNGYCNAIHKSIMYIFVDGRFDGFVRTYPFILILVSALLALGFNVALMALEFVNSYQIIKEWWRGPAMIYVLSIVLGKLVLWKLLLGTI